MLYIKVMYSRIINGDIVADRESYPWFCSILNAASSTPVGGGAYLGGQYILTSARRLVDSIKLPYAIDLLNTSEYTVRMGHLSQSDTSLFPKEYLVESVTVHPDFRYNIVEYRNSSDLTSGLASDYESLVTVYCNDLAIIKLHEVPSADNFTPVNILPTNLISDVSTNGTKLTAVGIGFRNVAHTDPDLAAIEDQIPDVPVELSTDIVYITENNFVRKVDLQYKTTSDSFWREQTKTHAQVVRGTNDIFNSTFKDIPVYYLDTSKNTNFDSSEAVNNNIYASLSTDWVTYWFARFQSDVSYRNPEAVMTSGTAAAVVISVRDTIAPVSLASDDHLTNKFFAADYGSDVSGGVNSSADNKGLYQRDEGAPIVYRHTDGKDYLFGIFNTGPGPNYSLNVVQDYFPSIFTNIAANYADWIAQVTANPTISDQDIAISSFIISNNLTTINSDLAVWVSRVSDSSYTSDAVVLWQADITSFGSDIFLFNETNQLWSTDLLLVQETLSFVSDTSIALLLSDLMVASQGYITDVAIVLSDQVTLASDGVAISDVAVFASDLGLFQTAVDGLSSDVFSLFNGLGDFNAAIDSNNRIETPTSYRDQYYRLRVSNPIVVFNEDSRYDIDSNDGNNYWFETSITGDTADVLHSTDGYFSLTVTNNNDSVIRRSRHYIPDQLGNSRLIILAGCLLPGAAGVNSVEVKLGYFDSNYGHYFKLDPDWNLCLCELVDGVELRVPQGGWNLDQLDGTGPSTLNLTSYLVNNGGVPQIVDLTYQHNLFIIEQQQCGSVRMGLFLNGVPRMLHQFNHEHYRKPYQRYSALPVSWQITKVNNLDDGSVRESRMTWCSVMIEGDSTPHLQRFVYTNARKEETTLTPAGVSNEATLIPLLSLRKRTGFISTTIKITNLELFVSSNNDIYWELIKNAELQSDTWLQTPPSGSQIEIDDTASRYARGTVLTQGFVSPVNPSRNKLVSSLADYLTEPNIATNIGGQSETLTLGVRNLRGNTDIKLWYLINWVEL